MTEYNDVETVNFLCSVTYPGTSAPLPPYVVCYDVKGGTGVYYGCSEFIETLYDNPKNQKLLNSALWKLVNI